MPVAMRKGAGVASWAIVLVLLLTVCMNGDDGAHDDRQPSPVTVQPTTTVPSESADDPFSLASERMTFDEMFAAYKASIDDYRWPPGYVPDADAMFAQADPNFRGGGFQPGYQLTMLTITNGCAWYQAWVAARRDGNERMEAEALAAMTSLLPTNPLFTDDPALVESIHKTAAQAALGDPTLVNQYLNANCQQVIWK